jgi:hypothetical protein
MFARSFKCTVEKMPDVMAKAVDTAVADTQVSCISQPPSLLLKFNIGSYQNSDFWQFAKIALNLGLYGRVTKKFLDPPRIPIGLTSHKDTKYVNYSINC